MNNLISVIIPAYNAEKFIIRAIDSVLNQSYKNTQIIVVNDGSTDKTHQLVQEKAKDNSNIILIDKVNGGVSQARNIGVEKATGEYITFLDADDELMSDAIEKMLRLIRSVDADILSTMCLKDWKAKNSPCCEKAELLDAETAVNQVVTDNPVTWSVWAKLYKTEKIKSIKFPEYAKFNEDSYFVFLCISEKLKFAVCDTATYIYHENVGSVSRRGFSEKMFDMVELAKSKKEIIDLKFPQFQDKTLNILIKAYMSLLENLLKTTDKKYRCKEKEAILFVRKNKHHFAPASSINIMWFKIIIYRLYPLYKIYYNIRHTRRLYETKKSN